MTFINGERELSNSIRDVHNWVRFRVTWFSFHKIQTRSKSESGFKICIRIQPETNLDLIFQTRIQKYNIFSGRDSGLPCIIYSPTLKILQNVISNTLMKAM